MKIRDIAFTNHAIDRMKERGVSGEWAWSTVKHPDRSGAGKEKHTTEFVKQFDSYKVTAIGKRNESGEWVILSVWMDPPLKGTADYRNREKYLKGLDRKRRFDKKMETAGFWGKMWLTFRKQAGL